MPKSHAKPKSSIDPNFVKTFLANVPVDKIFGKGGAFNDLKKAIVDQILESEMSHHLGYNKHDKDEKSHNNRRNGNYPKKIFDEHGQSLEISVPRDRSGEFEPAFIPKGVRRFEGFDDMVISMYARGMTMREIQGHLEEIYATKVSPELISEVTDGVIKQVEEWQNRPLDETYPIVYLDCIFVKARDGNTVMNKAVYLALGVNMEGKKEILGMWIQKTEGAKFWMQVVTELKNRGVKNIYIACVDGLNGFEEAINAVFPKTTVQTCIVHMIRNSCKYVPHKNRKEICADLKKIYTAGNEDEAKQNLNSFKEKWDHKFPVISDMWEKHWHKIIPIFSYPTDIRKAIYTHHDSRVGLFSKYCRV